jgi:hypothetical protein
MASIKVTALAFILLVVGAQAEQLTPTSVDIGSLSRDVVPGQLPSYIDVKPTAGPNADSYQIQVHIRNAGSPATITAVEPGVYVGSYAKEVPPGTPMLRIDATGVSLSCCLDDFRENRR